MAPPPPLYGGARALLATMHGKERVIAPLAARFLGLSVDVAPGLDTDAFGTFSRDVARAGSPLDAARAKIAAAFALAADVEVALASEGSFGPHPHVPFAALGRELVMLIDRESGLELVGQHSHDGHQLRACRGDRQRSGPRLCRTRRLSRRMALS